MAKRGGSELEPYQVAFMMMFAIFTLSRIIASFNEGGSTTTQDSSSGSDFNYSFGAQGNQKLREGNVKEAMALFEKGARNGEPWAAGSHSWYLLKTGEHKRAVDFFRSVEQQLQNESNKWRNDDVWMNEYANAKSNYALHLLALGNDPQKSLELWKFGKRYGHLESMFYPAILYARQGNMNAVKTFLGPSISKEARKLLRETLNEGQQSSSPWWKKWSQDGIKLLNNQWGS